MKKLLGKIEADMVFETLGFSMATYGISQFSVSAAWVFVGGFLIWLVESAN